MLVKVYKAFRKDMTVIFLVPGISVILSVAKYNRISVDGRIAQLHEHPTVF
jgi:hypothetical protein